MTRKRVLLLIPELGFGGAEGCLLRLGEWLASDCDVVLAVFRPTTESGLYTTEHRPTTLKTITLDSDMARGAGITGWFGRWRRRWRKLAALKRSHDVCISFLTGASLLNAVTPGRAIVSLRGSRQYDPSIGVAKMAMYRFLLDPMMFLLAEKTVVVSPGLAAEFGQFLPQSLKAKIVTIPVFVFVDEIREKAHATVEDPLLALRDQPVMLTFSRIAAEKGILDIIRVFAKTRDRVKNAKLLIVGDGPELDRARAYCASLELTCAVGAETLESVASDVVFLGYRADPVRYCQVARLFVLGSRTEGCPNSLIECLATDIQMVANNAPWGARWVLGDEEAQRDIVAYPVVSPTTTDYGVLMPRIDNPEFDGTWAEVIAERLDASLSEAGKQQRLRRLQEHGAESVGPVWSALIDTVVG